MRCGNDFYGYGTRADYVKFFARRGMSILEIATVLGTNVACLMRDCPQVDIFSYEIFPKSSTGWTNDEARALFEHYTAHGAHWDGWRIFLPRRSARAIGVCASRLGLTYAGNDSQAD